MQTYSIDLPKKLLSWDDLVTLLMEIEQCVNNRPLTYILSALPDISALTPNHPLKGEVTQIMPPVFTTDTLYPLYLDQNQLNQQYTKISDVINKFVQVWSEDYLAALKEKHFGNVPPIQAVNPLIPGILPEGLNIKSLSPRESFRKVRSFPGQALNEPGLLGG